MKTFVATAKRLLFAETDMSGWAHNSHFMRFVENAEHELLQSYGYQPVTQKGGWPRANFQIDFISPLVFNDPYQVTLSLIRLGGSSITWGFSIASGERPVAKGQMTSVLVNEHGRPVRIPDDIRENVTKTFALPPTD